MLWLSVDGRITTAESYTTPNAVGKAGHVVVVIHPPATPLDKRHSLLQ